MRVQGIPFIQGRNAYTDKDGLKFGIAIHDTSNDATARQEADYATRRTDGVSSHFYVDDTEIIQSLDTASRAGHAGSSTGNENAIAVEITGVNGWSRSQWLANVDWEALAGALRQVIAAHWPDGSFQIRRATVAEMKSTPKVKAFYGHDDMRQAWGGTTHTDPGPNFPWDHLFASLNPISPKGTGMAALLRNVDVGAPPNDYYVLADGVAWPAPSGDAIGWQISGRFYNNGAPGNSPIAAMFGNPQQTGEAPWVEVPTFSASVFPKPPTSNGGNGGDGCTCPTIEEIETAVKNELQQGLSAAKIDTSVSFPTQT